MSDTAADQGRLARLGDLAKQHIHLVGIGGIGLSAIARILKAWGAAVSGSDMQASPLTEKLAAEGIQVHIGHRAENIRGATRLIVSSAIRADNPELAAAQAAGVPVFKRADILGELMSTKTGVAIAGTHGKTTTTALVAHILTQAGADPTFVVGGIISDLGSNARAGRGGHFVIEADEYDHTFLGLRFQVAALTHLEIDHPDCFPTMERLLDAFCRFLALAPADGTIIACADEPHVREVLASSVWEARVIRYGLGKGNDWHAGEITSGAQGGNEFTVLVGDKSLGRFSIKLPGEHNVKNALAALVVAEVLGVDRDVARQALASFGGVRRRFEIKGEAAGVRVIDDYAHHPTAIRATLAAARRRYPGAAIWAVFQPHTFSRTAALFQEFAGAFGDADHVLVTEIYASRESRDAVAVQASDLARSITHTDARYCPTFDQAVSELLKQAQRGDLIITLGAGDGFVIGERVLRGLADRQGR